VFLKSHPLPFLMNKVFYYNKFQILSKIKSCNKSERKMLIHEHLTEGRNVPRCSSLMFCVRSIVYIRINVIKIRKENISRF
jgi:hypothetical protein